MVDNRYGNMLKFKYLNCKLSTIVSLKTSNGIRRNLVCYLYAMPSIVGVVNSDH